MKILKQQMLSLVAFMLFVSAGMAERIEPEQAGITVKIDGLVFSPGTYELKTGSRVQDLVEAAGGIKRLGRKERAILICGSGDNLVFHIIDLREKPTNITIKTCEKEIDSTWNFELTKTEPTSQSWSIPVMPLENPRTP